MAFIKHESSYQQGAKPERTRIFLDYYQKKKKYSVWLCSSHLTEHGNLIKKQQDIWFVSRRNFSDAVDFIGWYNDRSSKKLGIPKNNALTLFSLSRGNEWI